MATGKRNRTARKATTDTAGSTGQVDSSSMNERTTESAALRAAFDTTPFEDSTNSDVTSSSDETDAPKVTFVGEQIVYKDRYERIAEAAYLRAQQRGFEPGHEVEDWLAAEQEIDALFPADGNSNSR